MRIILQGGNNILGRLMRSNISHQNKLDDDGTYWWGDLLKCDYQEDLRIINIESCFNLTSDNNTCNNIHIDNLNKIFKRFNMPYLINMANDHVMDMGRKVFYYETLKFIKNTIGIGHDINEAMAPYHKKNILVFAFAAECSGVPKSWTATKTEAGVAFLPAITSKRNVKKAFKIIRRNFEKYNTKDKCIIVTVHWGDEHTILDDKQKYRRKLAHKLINNLNVSLIHGHSSHHIRGMELYKNKLILYGAGNFICDHNDTYDNFNLKSLQITPFEMRQFSCKKIVDRDVVDFFITNINRSSNIDCKYPLILK